MGFNLLGTKQTKHKAIPKRDKPADAIKERRDVISIPPGRVSRPRELDGMEVFFGSSSKHNILKPDIMLDAIPYIRTAYKNNPDLGSVLFDLVQLTNTGHQIKFDQATDPTVADKMREHLKERGKHWGNNTAGINGLINKITAQLWVAGAIAVEAAPNRKLTQVEQVPLINPETIRFQLRRNGKYLPFQKVDHLVGAKQDLIKLNTNTFIYCGLFGDEDTPYGVPPFLTALNAVVTQQNMTKNMNHILEQMGLLGYLQVLLEKPSQQTDEAESTYKGRLSSLLTQTKANILTGFKEGVVVGYEGDHEFEFNSTTKNLTGVSDLFNLNEQQIANGLKSPGQFLGLDGKGGEGQLGIIFTKMLSQIKNVHETLSYVLAKIYELELMLAGFTNFRTLEVKFNTSTISDDLKLWQGKEIKQRVLDNLYIRQVISSEQYADEMGYQKPFKVVLAEDAIPLAGAGQAEKDEKVEKDKDKSDRKVRDKNKPQPKRKDRDTK